jgi:ParB/RepB/Spo0J family partition protein
MNEVHGMIPEYQQSPVERFLMDPNNPRSDVTTSRIDELVASIKLYDIRVPIIGYSVPQGIMVIDGHRRLEAARRAGLKQLPAMVFPQKPSEGEILAAQLTINGHRESLNPVDEYEAFSRLAALKNWSHSELAAGLAVDNAEITRVMAIGKLSPEERQLVRDGKISKSAAYALSRMSQEQRAAMTRKAAAGEVTRDQLNACARKKPKAAVAKSKRLSFAISGGVISVSTSAGLTLDGLIEVFDDLNREFRKSRTQGLDVSTIVRVLHDRRRAQPAA